MPSLALTGAYSVLDGRMARRVASYHAPDTKHQMKYVEQE